MIRPITGIAHFDEIVRIELALNRQVPEVCCRALSIFRNIEERGGQGIKSRSDFVRQRREQVNGSGACPRRRGCVRIITGCIYEDAVEKHVIAKTEPAAY